MTKATKDPGTWWCPRTNCDAVNVGRWTCHKCGYRKGYAQ